MSSSPAVTWTVLGTRGNNLHHHSKKKQVDMTLRQRNSIHFHRPTPPKYFSNMTINTYFKMFATNQVHFKQWGRHLLATERTKLDGTFALDLLYYVLVVVQWKFLPIIAPVYLEYHPQYFTGHSLPIWTGTCHTKNCYKNKWHRYKPGVPIT